MIIKVGFDNTCLKCRDVFENMEVKYVTGKI